MEVSPTFPPLAVDAARRLPDLTSFNFACLALTLGGLVSDEVLEGADIPEPPARPHRLSPDEAADAWLPGDHQSAPSAPGTGT